MKASRLSPGSVRLGALSLAIAAISCGAAMAADPVTVQVTTDRAGSGTRLVITHSRPVDHVVQLVDGRLEVLYSENVDVRPGRERFPDDPLLDRYVARGRRGLVFYTGPAFTGYETFELNQPFRLVVDLEGRVEDAAVPGRPARAPSAVIVLDPGHGGVEHGAIGPSGLKEKDVTLHLAQLLDRTLEQIDPGLAVVLTRDDDRLVGLDERTAVANYNKADLFVSIHLNASPRPEATGAETYFLASDATDDEARVLAALENRAFGVDESNRAKRGGDSDSLDLVLWDMAQNHYLAESSALAESIQGYFNELTGTRDRGVRQAPFRVLTGATMPAVLVEVGFISNPEEERRFKTLSYRQQVVQALAFAVRDYLRDLHRYSIPVDPRVRATGPR